MSLPACTCGRPAVITLRYKHVSLCASCFMRDVEDRAKAVIRSSIPPGTRVAAALSGGKDSSTALYLTCKLARDLSLEVIPLLVDEGISSYRPHTVKKARELAEMLGLELVEASFKEVFSFTLDELDKAIPPKAIRKTCTYCGVLRRRLLNTYARKLGAKVLVTGHNLDDLAQTYLMNLMRGDLYALAKLGPYTRPVREKLIPRIRPLSRVSERESTAYAILSEIPFSLAECPYVSGFRPKVRDLLNEMEAMHPGLKLGLVKHIEAKLIPKLREVYHIGERLRSCEICGEPTTTEVCKVCEMLDEARQLLSSRSSSG